MTVYKQSLYRPNVTRCRSNPNPYCLCSYKVKIASATAYKNLQAPISRESKRQSSESTTANGAGQSGRTANMKKQRDGKNGCGAKRFSGAHPLRRAFHVRSGWLFFLSDFNGVLPPFAWQLREQFLKSTMQGVCLSAGAQRRHLYQDKHTPWCHYPRRSQDKQIIFPHSLLVY